MKQVWAGEPVAEAVRSDGLAGVTLDLDVPAVRALFEQGRAAWTEEGRPEPRLTMSFWFVLDGGDGSTREQIHRHLRHHMNWLGVDLVDAMAPTTGFAGTPDDLREVLAGFEDAGADEVQLIPTSCDLGQLHEAAELLG